VTPDLTVDFCGEIFSVTEAEPFVIGREGSLALDDNPYLHRRFLQISSQNSLWWLSNIGTTLTATVGDEQGLVQAWLAPGAQLPIVFDKTFVWFTAGPTTYEFEIDQSHSPYVQVPAETAPSGELTIGRINFTPDQKLLIVALSEDILRRGRRGTGSVPTSAAAAKRLGWTITKFNRKLDNVCQKLTQAGIRGLHGDADKLAVNRRARLVEYSLAARLVDGADLALLGGEVP